MRRVLVGAVVVAALAAGATPAHATNECRGLQVCVRVAGPWVAVPVRPGVPRPLSPAAQVMAGGAVAGMNGVGNILLGAVLIVKALGALSEEQLALRAAPPMRSAGQIARHMVGARAAWFSWCAPGRSSR